MAKVRSVRYRQARYGVGWPNARMAAIIPGKGQRRRPALPGLRPHADRKRFWQWVCAKHYFSQTYSDYQ
jgi:hypothetical protein